jgi:hypothetical protein
MRFASPKSARRTLENGCKTRRTLHSKPSISAVEQPMSYDKNRSPVGWYVASYLLRFIELKDDFNCDLEHRFTAWENTVPKSLKIYANA